MAIQPPFGPDITKVYTAGFFVIAAGTSGSSNIPQASSSLYNDFGIYNTLATSSLLVQGCPDLVNSSSVWLNVATIPSSSVFTFAQYAFDALRVVAPANIPAGTQIQMLGGIDPAYLSIHNV